MKEAEIYSIKLDREGGFHPDDISVKNLSELLRIFSKLFDGNDNDFCLSSIHDNCVRLDFKLNSQRVKTAALVLSSILAGYASDGSFFNALNELDRLRAKLPGVSLTFPAFGEYPSVTFPSDRDLSSLVKREPCVRYSHTIYGKVINAGGERPNIHIRPLGGGSVVVCDCSEELASETAHFLYSIVGVAGEVTQTGNVKRMKATFLLPYRKPDSNPFQKLRESGIGKYFENETVEDFMNRVRGTESLENV